MSAIICGRCGRCGFDPGEVLLLTDKRGKTYGFRAVCPGCDARTITASTFDQAKARFRRGDFMRRVVMARGST